MSGTSNFLSSYAHDCDCTVMHENNEWNDSNWMKREISSMCCSIVYLDTLQINDT